ncbi:MAG: 5-carboxymethyl-2-hydroxymuconate Delta-isomerase [Proteobacteria bacterium]|nr:5-carboxymethyl-2-hydroxymuconate Delta-isomerase [Pseudomonadota bacterium]
MPHLTLEYTANIPLELNTQNFFRGLHEILQDFDTISMEKIKSRAVRHQEYWIGAGGSQSAFVYLEIAMFTGRSEELRKEVSRRSLEYVQEQFGPALGALRCSITVEIREICKATFSSASGI